MRITKIFCKLNLLVILLSVITLSGCKKEGTPAKPLISDEEIITIPIVVHAIYSSEEFNISYEKIRSQIAVLNQDYRKANPDHVKTPLEFAPLVSDTKIQFELATKDPQGKPTSGITRTFSAVSGFEGRDLTGHKRVEDLSLYFTAKGGHDAWPRDKYLNVWVAEMSDRTGKLNLAGYAQFPGGDLRTDGVVIDPRVLGTLPPLTEEHKLGRTLTHEIGHWLNLYHVHGSVVDDCTSTDFVDDTPASSTVYLGSPFYPQYSCGQSSMFMNFMNLVNDEAMYMFTQGQKRRMRAVFAPDGGRYELYKNIRKN